jgi:hypothetical protein
VKRDAFNDVSCPFNYTAELEKARQALNLKVGTYISENPTAGYRELARMFCVSPSTLCGIAKKYSQKRKPGRRSSGTNRTFDVRHTVAGKNFLTRVTVKTTDAGDASVASMRSLLASYFKTNDIGKPSTATPERHAEFTFRELEELTSSASALTERRKPNVK